MDLARRRRLGGGIWVVGLIVALVWGSLGRRGVEARGLGFAPAIDVASLEPARVMRFEVSLHDAVGAEDVVVRMDSAPLSDQREVVAASLLAVQASQVTDVANDARRFAEGVQDVLVDRARFASQVQEDLALVETLEERLSIELDLSHTGASSSQAVAEWQRQIRVVQARIVANRRALSVVNSAADSAIERDAAAPQANQWEVVAATRQLEAIDARIERMDLRAGVDGQVTWIYRNEGEVVAAGEPIMQVRRTGTREVVAFVLAAEVPKLQAGDSASVRRATGQVLEGQLLSVGAGPQPLPESLWHNPAYPEYGVPVRLHLDGEVSPDEAVIVRL